MVFKNAVFNVIPPSWRNSWETSLNVWKYTNLINFSGFTVKPQKIIVSDWVAVCLII